MARTRGNPALLAQENLDLTPEETQIMEDNRKAQFEQEPEPGPATPEPPPTPVAPAPATPEPAPAPTPPEPAAPTTPAAPTEPTDKQRMVEFGALHEERERRKEERARREKAEAELARLTGRFSTLEELARAAAQPAPQATPDVNTDPVGHFQAEIAARDQKIAQFEQWVQQQQQQAREQQVVATIRQRAVAAEAEFARATPDYTEAADYVQTIRNAQLEAIGFTDPVQRQQQLAMEALNLAAQAEQRGQNAAAIIYAMAKATGWKPKASPAVATPAPAAPQVPIDQNAAKKLETVARGQAANQSIGKLNGQSAPTETSLDALLKMSDEDFDKATKGDAWRKLFT